jgi:hypothetical protein
LKETQNALQQHTNNFDMNDEFLSKYLLLQQGEKKVRSKKP